MGEGEALMAKAAEVDRVAELECQVEDLKRRIALLEAFVDVRHREKAGLTTDEIREFWHGRSPVPERGAV
jgi:hypothetical protein